MVQQHTAAMQQGETMAQQQRHVVHTQLQQPQLDACGDLQSNLRQQYVQLQQSHQQLTQQRSQQHDQQSQQLSQHLPQQLPQQQLHTVTANNEHAAQQAQQLPLAQAQAWARVQAQAAQAQAKVLQAQVQAAQGQRPITSSGQARAPDAITAAVESAYSQVKNNALTPLSSSVMDVTDGTSDGTSMAQP
jgi:hypothetical protein